MFRRYRCVFNFRGEDVFKYVKVLSGGEKSRLILAKLLIRPPNFILLDEPTTHLDIDGVDALTTAFKEYQGTLCFISHDLYFVKEIANSIIEVDHGQLKTYPGGLDYYLDKKKAGDTLESQKEMRTREEELRKKAEKRRQHNAESTKMKEVHDVHRTALKRIEAIKKEIKQLEQESKDLELESYAKARFLSNTMGKDREILKEYGQRLKWITMRLREIEAKVNALTEEKNNMSK